MTTKTQQICRKLGYEFKDPKLLDNALRHRSVGRKSNERLEFLGDAVLSFVIASELYRIYPKFREGELSRLRSNLVNGVMLANLALELDLGQHLHLGVGELKSGGAKRKSILADAVEALIGAIYLDSDIQTCRERILAWYSDRLVEPENIDYKDPKTTLQELLQAKRLPLPEYEIVKIYGAAHEQVFNIECRVAGLDYITKGFGSSRRRAEQQAAEKFLQLMEQHDK